MRSERFASKVRIAASLVILAAMTMVIVLTGLRRPAAPGIEQAGAAGHS